MAETLAVLGLLDPAIKLGRKAWKSYKIQAAFGEDFIDYSNHFLAERVWLDELLKTPILLFEDNDTRAELSSALAEVGTPEDLRHLLDRRPYDFQKARTVLSTLGRLSSLFEDCEKLIEKYLPPLDISRRVSRDGTAISGQATPSQSPPHHDNASQLQMSNGLLEAQCNDMQLEGKSMKARIKQTLNRLSLRPRRKPSSPTLDPSSKSNTRLDEEDVQDQRLADKTRSHAMQENVHVFSRIKDWTFEDAENFRELIHNIQDSNHQLEKLVVITDIRMRYQHSQSLGTPTSPLHTNPLPVAPPSNPQPEDDCASGLAVLSKVLAQSSKLPRISFTLGLKDSYKRYAQDAQQTHAYLQLASESLLFPIMAYSPASQTDLGPSNSYSTSSSNSEVLVAIAEGNGTSHAVPDLQNSWPYTHDNLRQSGSSSNYYENHDSFSLSKHAIKIFQHYPPSTTVMTEAYQILNDTRLRNDKELVGFRCHLAYNIAAFFLHAFTAPIKLGSHDLVFFLDQAHSDTDPEQLVIKLTAPYLSNLSHPPSTGSLHGQHTSQSLSVQKLGVLFQEIGSWTPIIGPSENRLNIDKAIDVAKTNAIKSRTALGLAYYNVLWECLNWQAQCRWDVFQEKVLSPLLKLKTKHGMPTDEVY